MNDFDLPTSTLLNGNGTECLLLLLSATVHPRLLFHWEAAVALAVAIVLQLVHFCCFDGTSDIQSGGN